MNQSNGRLVARVNQGIEALWLVTALAVPLAFAPPTSLLSQEARMRLAAWTLRLARLGYEKKDRDAVRMYEGLIEMAPGFGHL